MEGVFLGLLNTEIDEAKALESRMNSLLENFTGFESDSYNSGDWENFTKKWWLLKKRSLILKL
jgi:hypothetical protein